MGNGDVLREIRWKLKDRDIRAFKIYMERQGFKSMHEAFHEMVEIRMNQPPGKMII